MYKAIIRSDKESERKLYFKILKKSLKHKHTEAVRKIQLSAHIACPIMYS